jgi:hypothetical protein
MLTAVLLIHCQNEDIAAMDVQILAENTAAANLVRSLGGERRGTEQGISEYELNTQAALETLRSKPEPAGLQAIFAAFHAFL